MFGDRQPLAQSLDLDQALAGGHATSNFVPFLDLNEIQSSRAQIIVRGGKEARVIHRPFVPQ
jgi:hypothetical protein